MFERFEKIPIALRFFGIGFLFTFIFIGHIVFDLGHQLASEKRNLQMRLDGLKYLKETNAQIAVFQKIRGLTNLYLEGDKTLLSQIYASQAEARKSFAALTALEHPTDSHGCNEKLDVVRHRYEALEKNFERARLIGATEKEKKAAFDGYSDSIERLLYFNSYAAVAYNIGENADWHLFVLSELLSERIPMSIEVLGKLRGIVSGSIQHGALTPQEREEVRFYIKLLKHNRSIIQAKLIHIFEHDSRLKNALEPSSKAAITANQKLVKDIESYLTNLHSIGVDGKTFFSMATDNMDHGVRFLSAIHENLELQIREHAEARLSALQFKIYFECAILLGGLLLFWLFYLSSMGYIRKVENAEKAKADFLSQMSHEIRTPLNAILGFIGILKEKTKESESLMYIETIQKSSNHLLAIINDILDLSKIESGKLSVEPVPFHPRLEFAPIISIYRAKANEKGIAFETRIDPEVPKCITSDPIRLKQILSNLLSNAIKFTHENGSVTLHIGYDEEVRIVTIEVTDSGIGIPLSKQKKVFDPFTQAEASTTRHYGGTGLGLAICSKLVSMLEGEIRLESEEGKGSTFTVRVPIPHCVTCIVEYDNEVLLRQHKKAEPAVSQRLIGHILLVEDNETNRMYMEILLEKMGLTYDIAEDGLEAVEKFKTGLYDIILMDENMPRMNGLEAAQIILRTEREENRPHTPIIAVTANALYGDRELFVEAGMDGYLSKPVDKEVLAKLFERYLKKDNLIKYPIKSFLPKE